MHGNDCKRQTMSTLSRSPLLPRRWSTRRWVQSRVEWSECPLPVHTHTLCLSLARSHLWPVNFVTCASGKEWMVVPGVTDENEEEGGRRRRRRIKETEKKSVSVPLLEATPNFVTGKLFNRHFYMYPRPVPVPWSLKTRATTSSSHQSSFLWPNLAQGLDWQARAHIRSTLQLQTVWAESAERKQKGAYWPCRQFRAIYHSHLCTAPPKIVMTPCQCLAIYLYVYLSTCANAPTIAQLQCWIM